MLRTLLTGRKRDLSLHMVFTKPKEKAVLSKIPFWWAWERI